jgi:hypothetical protein
MTKTIQIRITKEDIDLAVKNFINKRITDICGQKIDDQIAIEVDEAIVEVRSLDYENRIKKLEEAVYGKKKRH